MVHNLQNLLCCHDEIQIKPYSFLGCTNQGLHPCGSQSLKIYLSSNVGDYNWTIKINFELKIKLKKKKA